MVHGIKVRLTTDLTKYHQDLIPGTEGRTVGQSGIWSRSSDRFIGVHFPNVGTFDVLWDSLEIIDPEHLAQVAETKRKRAGALMAAKNVVRTIGPAGGFKYLSYEYVDDNGLTIHTSTSDRQAAEELIRFFEQNAIEVKEVVLKRKH